MAIKTSGAAALTAQRLLLSNQETKVPMQTALHGHRLAASLQRYLDASGDVKINPRVWNKTAFTEVI